MYRVEGTCLQGIDGNVLVYERNIEDTDEISHPWYQRITSSNNNSSRKQESPESPYDISHTVQSLLPKPSYESQLDVMIKKQKIEEQKKSPKRRKRASPCAFDKSTLGLLEGLLESKLKAKERGDTNWRSCTYKEGKVYADLCMLYEPINEITGKQVQQWVWNNFKRRPEFRHNTRH